MKEGKGKHLTLLHLFTGYKITDKPISDMTALQYLAVMRIAGEISKFKSDNEPLVVI